MPRFTEMKQYTKEDKHQWLTVILKNKEDSIKISIKTKEIST